MKKILTVLTVAATLLPSMADAQNAITFYQMDFTHQRTMLNPAFTPRAKVNLSTILFPIPFNVHMGLSNTFAINDLYDIDSDDSLNINLDKFHSALNDNNFLSFDYGLDLLNLGFKAGEKNYAGINVSLRNNTTLRYPKGFMSFLIEGNGPHIGETLDFSFGASSNMYAEVGLLYQRQINDDLTVGGRLKYLKGIYNISTTKSDISLTTASDDYAWTLRGDIEANISTPVPLPDSNGVDMDAFSIGGNNGIGIDLGGVYKFRDDWTFSASVIDLGTIKWKENTLNLVSSGTGEFTFDGVEFDLFSSDSAADPFEGMSDSILNAFTFDTTRTEYSQGLGTKFMLGAGYNLNHGMDAAAVFHGRFLAGKLIPALTLMHNTQVGRWFNFGLSYTMKPKSFGNVGAAIRLNGGPMQWYVVSDNIAGAIFPTAAKNINIQTGFYFTFGMPKKEDLEQGDKNFDVDPKGPSNDPEKNEDKKADKEEKKKAEEQKKVEEEKQKAEDKKEEKKTDPKPEKEKAEKKKKSDNIKTPTSTGRKTLPVIE